jgi:NitT/TauT family transport system permease protein
VVGEYLGSVAALGIRSTEPKVCSTANGVFAGILLLSAFALARDWIVGTLEKRLMVWQPRRGETERL